MGANDVRVYFEVEAWYIELPQGGANYFATNLATSLTPVGLTGWAIPTGAGQPTITAYNPSPTGITIPAGIDLYGKFTAVTLASGAVAMHKSDKL